MNMSKSSNKMASHQVPRLFPYFDISRIQCLSCRCTGFVDLPATVANEMFPSKHTLRNACSPVAYKNYSPLYLDWF